MVTQFVAAFDDIIINRYNKSREVVDKIQVRYLYSPKERVVYDLINKNQNLTVPAVAVSVAGIERDGDRVFNKIFGMYDVLSDTSTSRYVPSPVPVNIDMTMSIVTKFQTDMDQILSNFIPYSNPYIVLSWPLPSAFTDELVELRSEVLWSGSVNMEYPSDLQASNIARITADTSFTIKGWLFPYTSTLSGSNIYCVKTSYTAVTGFDYI